ncbi:hypothetical protein KAR91_07205 [Candidatus Pacearchaeota archaeon]|nr:hypothetical protein [Candidatus Pacearchaeota archaeon]
MKKEININGKTYVEDTGADVYKNGDYILIRTGNCNVPKVYNIEIILDICRPEICCVTQTRPGKLSKISIRRAPISMNGINIKADTDVEIIFRGEDLYRNEVGKEDFETIFVDFIKYSCKLKEEERTYKIGDKFKVKEGWNETGDVCMIIEYGTDKVNLLKLERPSGVGEGVGETLLYTGIKIEDKQNITKEELEERWGDGFFGYYELIED